jgi:hypothetical protein
MRTHLIVSWSLASLLVAAPAAAATLTVGTGKMYATPCAAIAKANAGDTIQVDAGTYNGDTCAWSTDNLTVTAVGGRAKIDLTGVTPIGEKGIFTISAPNATIEHFELSGAAIASTSGNNGAGIRHQGLNLTVRDCYFHDNQDGILGAPMTDGQGEVLIEYSEFDHNGAGDGFSHNMYINHYAKFTLHGSWSHRALVGHLVKTRADENYLLYNRITDEDGTASYEIDVPNGGKTYILGNLIQQGTSTQNPTIISYEEEGTSPTNSVLELFIVNNSIVNDLGKGTFVNVGQDVTTPVLLENNIFVGQGTVITQPKGTPMQITNYTGNAMFVDQANFDYHLAPGSPCVDKGTTPGMGDGYALTPTEEYVQPIATEGRAIVNVIDIGAYELGGATDGGGIGAGGSASTGSSSSSSGSTSSSTTGTTTTMSSAGAGGGSGVGGGGTTGAPGSRGGCHCRMSQADQGASAAGLFALSWIIARRRRRSRAS